MQVPYGASPSSSRLQTAAMVTSDLLIGVLIAISILTCVFLNDHFASKGAQTRCLFIIIFLLPNISGTFGLGT